MTTTTAFANAIGASPPALTMPHNTQLHTPSSSDGLTLPYPLFEQPSRMTKPPTCPASPPLPNERLMQATHSVFLNFYELSHALARSLSPSLAAHNLTPY